MLITANLMNKEFIKTFFRFAMIGVLNTILNYVVYLFFFLELSVNYVMAGAIGFFSGAITGYCLNRSWTFRSDVAFFKGAIKYFLIQVFCLIVHMIVQMSVVRFLNIPEIYSQFFGIVVTTFLNFILSSQLVYRKKYNESRHLAC